MIIREGMMVRYKQKNEMGLVSEVREGATPGRKRLICWWHIGGTRSIIPEDLVEPISIVSILNSTFENEYAKASLIERQLRLFEGGIIDSLIEGDEIRCSIVDFLNSVKE